MKRRHLLAGLILVVTIAVGATSASAARHRASISGIFDARYCEVLELHGSPPNASVTVWNTLGQNRCPESVWKSLNPATIAHHFGDTLVVLNGPRYFLMDSVSATVGAHRTFNGLRTTEAATIPIRSATDLARPTYTDRTIDRANTWTWGAGRTLYELVAPGGDVYVMQAYAQIVDPNLTLSQLAGIGHRLKPPAGWRYRTVHLRRPYVLSVSRSATIVQDELENTYQLATPVPRAKLRTHTVNLSGNTHSVPSTVAGTIEDHGTIHGTPFGTGTVVLNGALANGHLTGSYRLLFPHGSVLGSVDLPYKIDPVAKTITFAGTSHFTGGTGIYRGITSGTLTVHDHNTLDGQHGVLTVAGSARYHG